MEYIVIRLNTSLSAVAHQQLASIGSRLELGENSICTLSAACEIGDFSFCTRKCHLLIQCITGLCPIVNRNKNLSAYFWELYYRSHTHGIYFASYFLKML